MWWLDGLPLGNDIYYSSNEGEDYERNTNEDVYPCEGDIFTIWNTININLVYIPNCKGNTYFTQGVKFLKKYMFSHYG